MVHTVHPLAAPPPPLQLTAVPAAPASMGCCRGTPAMCGSGGCASLVGTRSVAAAGCTCCWACCWDTCCTLCCCRCRCWSSCGLPAGGSRCAACRCCHQHRRPACTPAPLGHGRSEGVWGGTCVLEAHMCVLRSSNLSSGAPRHAAAVPVRTCARGQPGRLPARPPVHAFQVFRMHCASQRSLPLAPPSPSSRLLSVSPSTPAAGTPPASLPSRCPRARTCFLPTRPTACR